jgi:8-oxo-dGTP pyrophosphatase MutT (NUDIX family)
MRSLVETLRARHAAGVGMPIPFEGEPETLDGAPHVDAAVLVAITDRRDPGLILTRRNESLRKHPGQIAFAGGRADPEDDGPVATALREAHEEIGMPTAVPEIVGVDAPFPTASGFRIVPVVAVVPPDLVLVPLEYEVADIFEVPLAHVLDPANHVLHEGPFEGRYRRFYEIGWQDRTIWGVTAGLIVNLSRWLRG